MKKQKVYRGRRRRRNMALPLVLVLLLVAGAAVAIIGFTAEKAPVEEPDPSQSEAEALPEQEQPEASAPPQEEPEALPPVEEEPEAPAEKPESDGEEIAIPESLKDSDHLFPAGNGDYRLILVNKQFVMPNEIADLPLKDIGDGYRVQADMYDALVEMMEDAKAAGLPLYIVSGYRPIERSRVLYNNKVQELLNSGYSRQEAEAEAGMWIAPPGTSEHSTGLAADLISADYYTKLPDLLPEFEEFEEAKWLKEHCAEYGFILRFPKGKEDITQVVFEPWHFRYVGKQAAAEIMAAGITLEEYLGGRLTLFKEDIAMLYVKKLRPNALLPKRATAGSAGYDLFACLEEALTIPAGQTRMVPTGIAIDVGTPELAAFIFARSGIAVKHGVAPANCVGVVDSDYRGEVMVGLHNHSDKDYTIQPEERVAQLVLMPVAVPQVQECEELSDTTRGAGGFGSTGKL